MSRKDPDSLYNLCRTNILLNFPDPDQLNSSPDYYKDNLFELFNKTIHYKIQKTKYNTCLLDGCFFFKTTPYREISDMICFMYKVNSWVVKLGGLENSWNKYTESLESSREIKVKSSFRRGLSVDYF